MAELDARLTPSSCREADQKDVKRGLFPPFDNHLVDSVTITAKVSSPPSEHHPESSQELTSFPNQQTEEVRETITKAPEGEAEKGKAVVEEGIVEIRNEGNMQYMHKEESEGEVMNDNLRSKDNGTYTTSEGITTQFDAQMLKIIPLRSSSHDDQINIEHNVSGEKDHVVSNQECGSVNTTLKSPVRIIVDHEPPGNQESANLPCKGGDYDEDHIHITDNGKYDNEEGNNDGNDCSGGQDKDENGESTTRGVMKEEFGDDHEQGVAMDFESQVGNPEGGHAQIDTGTNTPLAYGEGSIPEGMQESIYPRYTVPSTEAIRIGSIQPTSEDGGEDIASVEGPISNEINTSFGPSHTEESQTDDLAKEIAPHFRRGDPSNKANLHVGETQIAGSSLVDTDVCVGSEAMVEEVETVIEEVYTVIEEVDAMGNQNTETQEVRIVNIEEVHKIGNNLEIQTGSSLGEVNVEETFTTGVSSERELHPSLDSQDVELFSVEELVRGEILTEQDVKKDISIETKIPEIQTDETKEILSIVEKSPDQMEIVTTKTPETQTDKTKGIFSRDEKSPEQMEIVITNVSQARPDTSAKGIFSTAEKSPEQMEIVTTNIPQTQPDTTGKESLKIAESSPDMQPETASKAEDLHLQKDNAVGHEVSEQEVQEIKGGKVWKRFGRKKYLGDVVDYDPENRWFKVVYEDGDEEDLDLDEVKEILLPRGTLPKSVSKKRGHPGEESDQERKSKQRKKAPTPKKSKAGFKANEGTISRGRKTAEKVKRPYRRRNKQQAESSVSKDVSSTTHSTMTGNEASETDELANVPNSRGEHNIESQHDESATEKTTSKRGRKKKTQSDTEVSTSSKLVPSVDHLAEEDSKEKRGRKRKIQFDAEVSTSNRKAEETIDDVVLTTSMHKDEIASNQNSTKKQKLSENIEESKSDRLGIVSLEEEDSFIGKQVRKDFNGTSYTGVVMEFDKAKKYFKVNYEGRDEEVLHLAELETVLIHEEICSVSTNH